MTWWARLVRRERAERQLDAELREHIERQVADYISEGMPAADARRRARLEFGGLDQIKEQCRDVRGTRLIEETVNDIVYACRLFRKNPGFSAIAVLTLALAIGANVSVFALIDALLLRPLPVAHARELIAIWRVPHSESFSLPQVEEFAARQDLFESLCAFGTDAINVGPPEAVEAVGAAWVTGHFYDTLGVVPSAGRLLRPDDDRLGAAPVAVITDSYWLRRFSRNPDVLGQFVLIDGVPVTIVGVTPPEFLGAMIGEATDVTLPVRARAQVQPSSDSLGDDSRWLRVLARPRDGMQVDQLEAQLGVLWLQRMKARTGECCRGCACADAVVNTRRGLGKRRLQRHETQVSRTVVCRDGARRPGLVDCVRQRGESSARPSDGTPSRSVAATRPRRRARPHPAPDDHRKRRAGHGRSCWRLAHRVGRQRRARQPHRDGTIRTRFAGAGGPRPVIRLARLCLYDSGRCAHNAPLRCGTSHACCCHGAHHTPHDAQR